MAIYHVFPTNDIKEHNTEDTTCDCEPISETQPGGDILIIHNSYDGREGLELANEILNPPVFKKHPRHKYFFVLDGQLFEVYKKSREDGTDFIKEVNKPDCPKSDVNGDPI